MKALSFAVKASVLVVALALLTSRWRPPQRSVSCDQLQPQVGGSVGPNGIGYAYLDHSNPFSGLAMKAFGC